MTKTKTKSKTGKISNKISPLNWSASPEKNGICEKKRNFMKYLS